MKRIAGIFIAIAVGISSYAFADKYFVVSQNMDVFGSLYREVNTTYVDDTDPSKLMRNFLDGMLKTLDPYTNYFSESQIEAAKMEQTGKFGGAGLAVEIHDGVATITEIAKGLSADLMGLSIGDKVLSIDGKETKGRTKDEIERNLRGKPNSTVEVTVEKITGDNKSEVRNFSLTRIETQETNVPFFGIVTPGIGVIRLKIFNADAGRDVRHAFDSLKRANPDLKSIILDLRGNPGGLLVEAVNVTNVFIPKNQLVVTTRGKVDEWNATYRTLDSASDTRIPVAVITDNMSASASEIVSGTIQDLDRGVIVGQKTYGKGLVQITKPLAYNTMLKVTTAKYYIPSGRCIQAINYDVHNADGSASRVPDSLIRAFKTKMGRIVYDGGGVNPDVVLTKTIYSRAVQALISRNMIFDFATRYRLSNKQIAKPADFKLSDSEYNDFVAFAKSKNFTYKTESEEILDKLKESATDEKYFESVKEDYNEVLKKIGQDKQQDLLKEKATISKLLEAEIVGRFYYVPGKEEKQLLSDERVAKAIEILQTPARYNEILSARK
jgi:carboxyl-terminal processing protease